MSIELRRGMDHRLEVMVKDDHCSVGYVAKIIVRMIFHYTREVGLMLGSGSPHNGFLGLKA